MVRQDLKVDIVNCDLEDRLTFISTWQTKVQSLLAPNERNTPFQHSEDVSFFHIGKHVPKKLQELLIGDGVCAIVIRLFLLSKFEQGRQAKPCLRKQQDLCGNTGCFFKGPVQRQCLETPPPICI